MADTRKINDFTSPFDADSLIKLAAERTGFTVQTLPIVKIDPHAMLPAHYTRRAPDYAKIRRALLEGEVIPGCELSNAVTYRLTPADFDGDGPHD